MRSLEKGAQCKKLHYVHNSQQFSQQALYSSSNQIYIARSAANYVYLRYHGKGSSIQKAQIYVARSAAKISW